MIVTPGRSESSQTCEFRGSDGLKRMPEQHTRTSLDLDEHELVALSRHNVEFALRAPPIAIEDLEPCTDEVVGREGLAVRA